MDWVTVIIIAVGLAMDAFAVSIAEGVTVKKMHVRHALRIAFFFGLFQAAMPVIGWLAGLGLKGFIQGIDHWVAFGILCFIGGKMIYESRKLEEEIEKTINPLNIYILFTLAIATSIDALAVGLTFSFLNLDNMLVMMFM